MRLRLIVAAILLISCGSERNIEYEIGGSGSKGLTISYRNGDNEMASVSNPSLPWSKWIAMETGDTAEVVATCSHSGLTEGEDGACCLGNAKIKNPDNITLESDKLFAIGCTSNVEVKYVIDY